MSKLGDLIREGAKLYPRQAFNSFYEDDAACALGGAVLAWWASKGVLGGTDPKTLDTDEWESEVCELLEDEQEDIYTYCPVDDCASVEAQYRRPIQEVVEHLNDHHRWSRERIADWVDQQEEVAHGVATR